jgi:hypothetical protein
MKTYAQKLQDPRWQKARLRKLEEAGWACENCGADDRQLHVHHPVYVKGREPWEYGNEELQVLCHECHSNHHAAEEEMTDLIASNSEWMREVFGVVAGWVSLDMRVYPDSAMAKSGCGKAVACGQVAKYLYTAPEWVNMEIGKVISRHLGGSDA